MHRAGDGAWRSRFAVAVVATTLIATPAVLAVSDATVTGGVRVSPLTLSLELSTTTTTVGQMLQAQAAVWNVGSSTIREIHVELRVDPDGLRVNRGIVDLARVNAGKTATIAWSVCARVAATYILLARATADGASTESPARVLTIAPGRRSIADPCPREAGPRKIRESARPD